MMTKRTIAYCAGMLLSIAGLAGGCGDTVMAKNCSLNCQDVDNACVQKCTDDQCRTACKTDLDNCTASCGNITIAPGSPDSGGQ